jgi:hypothetical protein
LDDKCHQVNQDDNDRCYDEIAQLHFRFLVSSVPSLLSPISPNSATFSLHL